MSAIFSSAVEITITPSTAQIQQTATATEITFVESGLPEEIYVSGKLIATNWSVVVDGTTYSGTAGSPIKVTATAGVSHTYTVNTVMLSTLTVMPETYYPSPASGTATAGQTVNVTYVPRMY